MRVSPMPPQQASHRDDLNSPSDTMDFPSYLPPPSPPSVDADQSELDEAEAMLSTRFPSLRGSKPPTVRKLSKKAFDKFESSTPDTQSSMPSRPSFSSERSSGSIKAPQPKRPTLVSASPELQNKREFSDGSSRFVPTQTSGGHSDSGSSIMRAPSRGAISVADTRRPSLDTNQYGGGSYKFPQHRPPSSSGRKSRPVSMFLDSSVDFLRNLGRSESPAGSAHSGGEGSGFLSAAYTGQSQQSEHIESNLEFLKSLDTGGSNMGMPADYTGGSSKNAAIEKRSVSAGSTSGKHSKRASMPVINLTGRLSGKFGDAFKKFEQQSPAATDHGNGAVPPQSPRTSHAMSFERKRTPSPSKKNEEVGVRSNNTGGGFKMHMRRASSAKLFRRSSQKATTPQSENAANAPITSAVPMAASSSSTSWNGAKESPIVSDAMEKRAAARNLRDSDAEAMPPPPIVKPKPATKPALADKTPSLEIPIRTSSAVSGNGQRPRAQSIQNRVHSLLEHSQSASVTKTASGYGKYTDHEDNAIETGLPRAATIGEVGDTLVPETYTEIEPMGDLEAQLMSSQLDVKPGEAGFDEANFLAQASARAQNRRERAKEHLHKAKNKFDERRHLRIHSTNTGTALVDVRAPSPFEYRSSTVEHRRQNTVSSTDSLLDRPAPPPKPAKLQSTGTPSVTSSPSRNVVSASSPRRVPVRKFVHDNVDSKEWELSFEKKFPSLPGIDVDDEEDVDVEQLLDDDLSKLDIRERKKRFE